MHSEQRASARELDVRDVDGEPFSHVMDALSDLGPGETLRLVNSFEPVPLYGVLDERGYTHEAERIADDEWHVYVELA